MMIRNKMDKKPHNIMDINIQFTYLYLEEELVCSARYCVMNKG